jgi:predicted GNAT family acetyltransferase
MELDIRHDLDERRFFAVVEGKEAFLDYGVLDDRLLEYRSTFVPPNLRHRGIATRIIRHALDWARSNGYRVVPSCWFVAAFIRHNPEYEDARAES